MTKTLESMFIEMFEEVSKVNMELTLEVKSLEDEIKNLKNSPVAEDERNYIYLENKPYYYYDTHIENAWNWNEILIDNNKTPEDIEKALESEKYLLEIAKLKEKDGGWYRNCIGEVIERQYDYLFKDRKGRTSVIVLSHDDTNLYRIGESHRTFLDKEEANQYMIKELKDKCKDYLKRHKDKFEEEKAKREAKENE